ncbi:TPA: NAD(P)/FAD-dependent oxidoreductase [Candidatus Scatousia excrementigallinarum]|uniref:NAD(P)/FAD-dependent oxidoreductase n=1 Tax=Candidatus Scatousia excrementigallinarum TaxID=2840935 RepID=A0A9D1EW69_9BACT|nr:NAD(P)/FAD-dependent oxidoreductase [Candidatus Scatousia excrementigallinarum]
MGNKNRDKIAVIIGAGPAGLSAAYYLLKKTDDIKPVIIEELDCVGGISRTVHHNGNGIDLGGHRLFSKNQEILDFWEEILPLQGKPPIDDKILKREITVSPDGPDPDETDRVMLKRRRVSRIYYLRKFFDYPISLKASTILNMGLGRTFKAGMSYLKSCVHKVPQTTLEDFMINRFGKVLYKMFFEKYTQKVWGLHPSEISKEWGEQRIKGLSLSKAVLNALLSPLKLISNKEKETSLIEEYYYPKFGCGQVWEFMANEIIKMGGEIHFNTRVVNFETDGNKVTAVKAVRNDSRSEKFHGNFYISSMPVKDLIAGLGNQVPADVLNVAKDLPYRDYILAGFYCNKINLKNNTKIPTINNICPDSWIYIQEDDITAGRLQIMNNWSPYLVKDFQNKVFISLEYFCNEGDSLWNKSEKEMLDFALSELEKLNIAKREDVIDSVRVRVKKAYPAYFGSYSRFDSVKEYLNSIENLYCIGRNGQHKYNNMDHSMLSGIEAVNVIKNKLPKDILWKVNTEKEYHEVKK